MHNKLLLLCTECDTIWAKPGNIRLNNPVAMKLGKLETPSLEEIQKLGWDKLLISIDDIADPK